LLPFQFGECFDERFSCRPNGLLKLAPEPRDLIFDLAILRVPAGVSNPLRLGFVRSQVLHHELVELVQEDITEEWA
jgi:hypothetical protein